VRILNLTTQLTIAAIAMAALMGLQAGADPANSDSYTQIEADFNAAQKINFADLAKYGEFSRSNMVNPTTTQITTQAGAWSFYIVNVVQDDSTTNTSNLLVENYPLMAGQKAAQAVIRADNTMTVENLFNNNNLDCYDFSKLPTTLVPQETEEGVVLTNMQRDFYKVSATCTPKFDKIITTIKQTDMFLVIRTDYVIGDKVSRIYNYGWRN